MRLAPLLFILSAVAAQAAPSDWPPPWASKPALEDRRTGARSATPGAAPDTPVIGAAGGHGQTSGADAFRAGAADAEVGFQTLRVDGANKPFSSNIGARPPKAGAD